MIYFAKPKFENIIIGTNFVAIFHETLVKSLVRMQSLLEIKNIFSINFISLAYYITIKHTLII